MELIALQPRSCYDRPESSLSWLGVELRCAMWSSKVFAVMAALALTALLTALPSQVASAQPPSTQVVAPSTGATVSGTQVVLDASASAGVTQVQFELTGGALNDFVIATATPTIFGWASSWNSTTVVSGTYTLQSVATAEGSSGTSTGISITLSNREQTMSLLLPSNGSTVSGTQVVFDAVGPVGVTGVQFFYTAAGCPAVGTPPGQIYICSLNATPTIYGWVALWNSTEVPNGTYQVLGAGCGQCGFTPPSTSIGVSNPTAAMALPANDSTVTGFQWLDCVPPAGYNSVVFWIEVPGSPDQPPVPQFLGDGTPTYVGWVYDWNSDNEGYFISDIYCTAVSPSSGANAFSPTVTVYR